MSFIKVRFSKGSEHTAGLIFDVDQFKALSIGEVSRRFPMFEAMKMERLETSPEFDVWGDAFLFAF